MTSLTEVLADKISKSNIPDNEKTVFLFEVLRRFRTGSYSLPESMVRKYKVDLDKSPYKDRGCKKYYLRELIYLPEQALYDYYNIMIRYKRNRY